MFKVGNGWRVKILKDKWYGDLTLGETFPFYFILFYFIFTVIAKDDWVVEVWDQEGERCWNSRFSRQLCVGEF